MDSGSKEATKNQINHEEEISQITEVKEKQNGI